MTEPIKKNLSQNDKTALTEWGITVRSGGSEITIDLIAKRLKEIGIKKEDRTLFRYKKKIDKKYEELIKENKYSLDGFLDWEQKNFFDEFINPDHISILREACFWYELNVTKYPKHPLPFTVTYRWAKWASYFLSAVPNPLILQGLDVWAVGQHLASRDLIRSIGGDADNMADIEGWLMARAWEREEKEQEYLALINIGRYIPLKRIGSAVNPERTTMSKVIVPFLANGLMSVLSLPDLKDHEDYEKCYLLPSQQIKILNEEYDGDPPRMKILIHNFEDLEIALKHEVQDD